MNLRDIDYILTAAETGSFAKAAELCYVSQPSLSIQVKKVEQRLGHAIFVRHKNGVRLSPFGAEILPHLKAVQANVADVTACAKRHDGKSETVLKLGAIATVAPYIFTEIADLENIVFEESVTSELIKKLLDDEIDAALLAIPVKAPSLTCSVLYREPFFLAAAKDNEAAEVIDLETLDNVPQECRFVVLSEEHCLAEQVLHLCRLDMRQSLRVFRASSLEMARRLVAVGHDVTLIPARALRPDDGLHYRPLGKRYYRDIGLVYRNRSDNLAAIQKLYRDLKERDLGNFSSLTGGVHG